MNELIFNKKDLEQLQLAYGKAMANDDEEFQFDNEYIEIKAAKWLIRYLEKKLGDEK